MANAPENAASLPRVMNNFHRFTANWLSRNGIPKKMQKYFHNYWDTCIDYESSYYSRLNYIWFNPVKHGVVDSAEDWPFGSYVLHMQEDVKEITAIIERFPCDQVKIRDEF